MTKTQKSQTIDRLTVEFKTACSLVVCDYKGLTVRQLEELRKLARSLDMKVEVIKNTLAKISMDNAGYPDLDLKDTNIFVWGKEQIALSKLVVKFTEANKEKFVIRLGYFEDKKVDLDHIIAISKLPSRDELIGMLLSVWTAPARYFVTGLDNLKKQKEAE